MTTTTLYRFYDVDDRLLYVGIAMGVNARWAKHSKDKGWWTEVASARIEHLPSRDAALDAEWAAIRDERPIYNVVGNRGPHRRPNTKVVGVTMRMPEDLRRRAKANAARRGLGLYEYLAATIDREMDRESPATAESA